jgi:hypothetical protein
MNEAMNKTYIIECWKRVGEPKLPSEPEDRILSARTERVASSGWNAALEAAEFWGLKWETWGNSARPKFVLRVTLADGSAADDGRVQ